MSESKDNVNNHNDTTGMFTDFRPNMIFMFILLKICPQDFVSSAIIRCDPR